ncbi:glycosyltransferase family 39 protein [Patescibacteria group bacterium]|nr:glycosyltransferase family 39 protein [Patescibacteria group bacterium]
MLLCILAAGAAIRYRSLSWNRYEHGDIALYGSAAESIVREGNFRVPFDLSSPHWYSVQKLGGRFYELYPLWSIIGAGGIKLVSLSGFQSLKLFSFLAGIALIAVSFFVGKAFANARVGMFCAACASFSYLLTDYSANGAFYGFQAMLYLLLVWILYRLQTLRHVLLAGVVMGLALLVNFQSVALVPAFVAFLFLEYRRDLKKFFVFSLTGLGIVFVMFLPWLIREYILFGNPFYFIEFAATYTWQKIGALTVIKDNVKMLVKSKELYLALLKKTLFFWLPHNLHYVNRKLFILTPMAYIGAWFLGIEAWFSGTNKEMIRKVALIFLVLFFHILLSVIFPIVKFRYFVPMVPLVFLAGGIYFDMQKPRLRNILMAGTIILVLAGSWLTYRSVPSHTYYYDGAITTDIFGNQGERDFIQAAQDNASVEE